MRHKPPFATWLIAILTIVLLASTFVIIPTIIENSYGPSNPTLNGWERFSDSFSLLWNGHKLTQPVRMGGSDEDFEINNGDTVFQISERLQKLGLIQDAGIFRIYLIWKGLDTTVQSGKYKLNPAMTSIEIANRLQDATPSEVEFNVLPGWRMEEIAALLPTSGLKITQEEFISAVYHPKVQLSYFPEGTSVEGFLFPGSYTLSRDTTADQLVSIMVNNFALYLSSDLIQAFSRQGLDIYQAVILASIIEREAIIEDEQPMIASIFLNRLNIGMKMDSDPTVQYAIGLNQETMSWWKNPLSLDDIKIDSVYNTYLNPGLPPAPISNPNLNALNAVAYPAQTSYFYFRARCDGSRLHSFSETFEEHLQNACK